MEEKDKKNVLKNGYCEQKNTSNDQTIILHPKTIKLDGPQEKTRTRAIFNCSKSKVNCNWMAEVSADEKDNSKADQLKKDSARENKGSSKMEPDNNNRYQKP